MRPEGWKNPYEAESDLRVVYSEQDMNKAYEAGADAMYQPAYDKGKADCLEELKKEGTHTNVVDDGLDIKGWRVFIPEERRRDDIKETHVGKAERTEADAEAT